MYAYWRGTRFYGETLHASGDIAAWLLIATLAVTPLSLTFPRASWTRWLRSRRRNLGVSVAGYGLLHTFVYLQRQADLSRIAADAAEIAISAGWLALVVFLVLAATSNDASMRLLRRRWKWLHRGVYAGAILTFAHWILTAFDPLMGIVNAGILAALEAYRLWRMRTFQG